MPKNKSIKWIRGDGGPVVVLQASAVPRWRGASDWNPVPTKGHDTDYGAICRCDDGISMINRHGRDMLVLSDSEWEASFITASVGEFAMFQWFGSDASVDEVADRLLAAPPAKTLRVDVVDPVLRMLVGADDANGTMFGFTEFRVQPGVKACDVYYSKEAQLALIRPQDR